MSALPSATPPAHARAGWIVAAAFAVLYAATANRGLQFGDAGEFQSVALFGGIPHASGYPLWVLLARAFAWLPLGAPEFRVTLFSAACGALTLGVMVRRMGEMGIGLAASITAAGVLGLSFSFWRVSGRAEVYALTALLIALAFGEVLRRRSLRAAFLLGLTMLVHLEYAPLVGVAGLALAGYEARRPNPLPRLAALLGVFLAPLSGYLLIPVLDVAGVGVNHLDVIRERAALLGHPGPPVETPWEGLRWLLADRNLYPAPASPFGFHPRSVLDMGSRALPLLVLFELGPVAVLVALAGLWRRWRRDRGLALALAAACAGTLVFTAWLQHGAMLQLFLLPAIQVAALFVADGLDPVFAAVARADRRGAAAPAGSRVALAALLAVLALAVPPHVLRVVADRRPIGPAGWRVTEEDVELRTGWLPGVPLDRGADEWAEAALQAFPRDARVFANWSGFAPLRHRQRMRGIRSDVVIRQLTQDTIEPRLRRWQAERDPAESPIVLVAERERVAPLLAGADSLALPGGRIAWVLRAPVDEAALARFAAPR